MTPQVRGAAPSPTLSPAPYRGRIGGRVPATGAGITDGRVVALAGALAIMQGSQASRAVHPLKP